jgi:hypothetical protein
MIPKSFLFRWRDLVGLFMKTGWEAGIAYTGDENTTAYNIAVSARIEISQPALSLVVSFYYFSSRRNHRKQRPIL